MLDPFKLSECDASSWDNEANILWVGNTPDVEIGFLKGSGKLSCWHCAGMGCRVEACDWGDEKLGRAGITLGI